jgi:hypothetical protein
LSLLCALLIWSLSHGVFSALTKEQIANIAKLQYCCH